MVGLFIVIDGTDGSGKKTQTEAISKLLTSLGFRTERIEFPQHGTRSAALIDDYLNGKYGTANQVGPHIASLFYACDRYDASFKIRKWLEEGVIVIADRYTSSNMGHQAGKFSDLKQRDKFLEWLDDLEFNTFKLPRPNIQVLLYMPVAVSQELINRKSLRQYISKEGANKDIHEKDVEHLKNAAAAYMYVAKKYGWNIIDCAPTGEPRPIAEITKEVVRVIAPRLSDNKGLKYYLGEK